MAAVLHDDASQVLAYAQLSIDDVARDVAPAAQSRLAHVRERLQEVAEHLRRLSHDLHPSVVDDLGIVDAINYTSRAFARRSAVQLTLSMQLPVQRPRPIDTLIYRFVQEALTNITRHARAASASIALSREGRRLVCTIADDGAGFDVERTLAPGEPHLGLVLIRARLEAAGGSLEIVSSPGQGTRLRAAVPEEI